MTKVLSLFGFKSINVQASEDTCSHRDGRYR